MGHRIRREAWGHHVACRRRNEGTSVKEDLAAPQGVFLGPGLPAGSTGQGWISRSREIEQLRVPDLVRGCGLKDPHDLQS